MALAKAKITGWRRLLAAILLMMGGLTAVPVMLEAQSTNYQFDRPFILDSSEAQNRFGLAPTPWREALAETVRWMKAQG